MTQKRGMRAGRINVVNEQRQISSGYKNMKGGAMEKIYVCTNCGKSREMAEQDLCHDCYRRVERTEHKKLVNGFASIMGGLLDLEVSFADLRTIRRIVEPYVQPIRHFLEPQDQKRRREPPRVNDEDKF